MGQIQLPPEIERIVQLAVRDQRASDEGDRKWYVSPDQIRTLRALGAERVYQHVQEGGWRVDVVSMRYDKAKVFFVAVE